MFSEEQKKRLFKIESDQKESDRLIHEKRLAEAEDRERDIAEGWVPGKD